MQETSDGVATPTGQLETFDAGRLLFDPSARSGGLYDSTQQQPYPPDGQQYGGGGKGYGNLNSPTWNFNNPLPFPGSPHEHGPNGNQGRYPDRQSGFGGGMDQQNLDQHNNNNQRNGHGKRTVYLTKLPERVTYAKIFDVIRGGAVVDVWVKASDHAASVSFIECDAAENFYQYARKNDIYIDGRRVIYTSPFSINIINFYFFTSHIIILLIIYIYSFHHLQRSTSTGANPPANSSS